MILPEAQSSVLGTRNKYAGEFKERSRRDEGEKTRDEWKTNLVQISITMEGASPERTLVR